MQTEPFDINDLCARLEVAKREREEKDAARELRHQVREAVKREEREQRPTTARRRPKPTLLVDVSNDWSRVSIPGLSPLQDNSASRSYFIDSIPEHTTSPSAAIQTGPTPPLSAGDGDRSRETPTRTKRMSFFKSLTSDGSDTRSRNILTRDRPEDVAKRRSLTSPLLQTRFKNDSSTNQDRIDSSRPSASDHSMSFVNEYCVSFDTCHSRPNGQQHVDIVESPHSLKPLPIHNPDWAYPSERRLLDLPLMLKKDRKDRVRASVVEISAPAPQVPSAPALRAPRMQPHTRSNTAPEGLICEAVRRIEREERGKKRRSMGALLQSMLLPHHSVNAASSHCVAI